MAVFTAVLIWGSGYISMLITAIIGGGVSESYIYPLYAGIVLLAGLVVGCTCVVLEKIKELEEAIKKLTP
jgi:hypothetical protein